MKLSLGKVLALLLAGLGSLPAWACVFPDSGSGAAAPAWICEPAWPDVAIAAIGSRGHMPSISTQNRHAARAAMHAVAQQVQQRAAEQLQVLAGKPLELPHDPYAGDDLALLRATPGVRVYSRQRSPGRVLYVLAGLEAGLLDARLASHRRAWLEANAEALDAQLGSAALADLQRRVAADAP